MFFAVHKHFSLILRWPAWLEKTVQCPLEKLRTYIVSHHSLITFVFNCFFCVVPPFLPHPCKSISSTSQYMHEVHVYEMKKNNVVRNLSCTRRWPALRRKETGQSRELSDNLLTNCLCCALYRAIYYHLYFYFDWCL